MLTDGYKETEIGVIPVEWDVKTLSEIGSFSKGKGISKNEIVEDGIPCMRYAEIYTEYDTVLKNIKSFINEKSAQNSKKITNGDILFAGSGETLDDIGKSVAFIDDFEAYVGGDTVVLSPTTDYNSLFMSFQLNSTSVRTQLRKLGQGSSVVHIYSSGLETVKVPFPPLKEQEKIADILSTADEKIDAIELQIQKAETLKKGLLQKLLSEGIGHSEFKDSELGKIPKGWEVVELPHITDKITSGGTPSRKKAEYFENGTVNWIKTGELRDCYIYNSKEKITEDAVANSSAKVFPVDTLLIAMYGATIGRTAYLKTECSTNQACCAIIFNQSIADPYFYWKYFHFIKDDLISQGRGAGQPNISQSIIKTLLVPFPPLEEQKQIADILSTADDKLEVLRAKKEKYQTLKKGLLQKLLSGEVRV